MQGDWARRVIVACVFPRHLITLTANRLWYISVQPRGAGRFEALRGVAIAADALAAVAERDAWPADLRAFMDLANAEDKPLAEGLCRGPASPRLPPGRLHPIERNIRGFTRYLARMTGGGTDA